MKKICVITGSRSDYGLLEPVIAELKEKDLFGTLISVGSFNIANSWVIEGLPNSDTAEGTCTAQSLIMSKLPVILKTIATKDLVLLLGDRFEIFAAAQVAYNLGIPIAHIEGSDTTLGSLDEGYRKCIRDLATLHFDVEEYGSLGCVFPEKLKEWTHPKVLIVYHPHKGDFKKEFQAILDVIGWKYPKNSPIFISSNADAGGRWITEKIKARFPGHFYDSLPRVEYIGLLKKVDFIIGNSSSGIIEAPSLKTPTINVGDRQKGRMKAISVIDCEGTIKGIKRCLRTLRSTKETWKWKYITNPYEKENTVKNIVAEIEKYLS